MSIEFEIETTDPHRHDALYIAVEADSAEGWVEIARGGSVADGSFTGDQMRQLRRFLEYTYPASEDPPHDPDPWVS